MLDGEVDRGSRVQLPLSMVNRHGLVAGATGTGKTKTLQILAGQLSDAGVPVFVRRREGRPHRDLPAGRRHRRSGGRAVRAAGHRTYEPRAHPVELLSLTRRLGAQVRATVHSFGPLLLGQGARSQQDADLGAHARLQVLRRRATTRCSIWPTCGRRLKFLVLGRGQAGARGVRRRLEGHVGVLLRSLVELEEAGAGDVLRRARVRRRTICCASRPTARAW